MVCFQAAATVLAMATIADQKRPDFNGQWVLDEKRTAQAAKEQESRLPSGGDEFLNPRPRGERLQLKVDATSLTMTSSGSRGQSVQTWTLDGVDRSGNTDMPTSAEWRGRTIEIKLKYKGFPPIRTELSLDGAWLVIKDFQKDREAGEKTAWRSRFTYYRKAR